MPQLVSTAANSTYTEFDTRIPSIGDTADIVEAFRLYHYGKANYTDGSAPADNSIYAHLLSLREDVDTLQVAPTGGQVTNEVPHDLDAGAVKVDIPNGYIWVDKNSTGSFNIEQGTVAFTNSEPGTYSHGLIWVDKNAPITDPFSLDNFLTESAVDLVYLKKTAASATYATIASLNDYSPKIIPIVSASASSFPITTNEAYKVIVANSSSDISLVISTESTVNLPIGASFSALRTGSGNVTFSGAAGVTVAGTPGTKLRAVNSFATCLKIASDSWIVIGDTAVA